MNVSLNLLNSLRIAELSKIKIECDYLTNFQYKVLMF